MELRVYLKVTSPFLRKLTALLYLFCDLRVFSPLKKFTSVPLSSDWFLVIFPPFWLVPVIKNHSTYFFVNWQGYILEVSQRANKNDFLVTEADVFSPSFPFFFFFLHFRRWHEQKCESFADGQTQSTDGQDDGPQGPPTNGCVFSAINQNFSTNFFVWRHFFCSETLFSSNITVTPTIYAVVALSKIRHKWRWYTQGNEAFYWARRLPNSAFADIYRMIGLRSRYPFY